MRGDRTGLFFCPGLPLMFVVCVVCSLLFCRLCSCSLRSQYYYPQNSMTRSYFPICKLFQRLLHHRQVHVCVVFQLRREGASKKLSFADVKVQEGDQLVLRDCPQSSTGGIEPQFLATLEADFRRRLWTRVYFIINVHFFSRCTISMINFGSLELYVAWKPLF